MVLALALSLAGDVLLVLPADRFALGLAAFLVAHVAYIAAFSTGSPLAGNQLPWLVPFLAVTGGITASVWSRLGRLRAPLLVYVAAISVMAWRAAMRGQAASVPRASFQLALLGACLFIASDALLVLRRFRRPFRAAHEIELAAYWAAQLLIALSVRT